MAYTYEKRCGYVLDSPHPTAFVYKGQHFGTKDDLPVLVPDQFVTKDANRYSPLPKRIWLRKLKTRNLGQE